MYQEMEAYDKAAPLFRQAIKIERTALREFDPDFAQSLNDLAKLYAKMGAYDKAELLFRQAQEITGSILE